jgi:hypothetical protein
MPPVRTPSENRVENNATSAINRREVSSGTVARGIHPLPTISPTARNRTAVERIVFLAHPESSTARNSEHANEISSVIEVD